MQTIRTRLSLNYLLVVLLGMALAGTLTWLTVEQAYLDTQRENLLAQANLIAKTLQGTPLPAEPAQPYSQILNAAPGVHTRILGEGGAVVVGVPLAEAPIQMPAAEQYASLPPADLLQRSEIASALDGIPATAIRHVLGGQRVLYAAAPVYATNGQINGIVYIATPLPASGLPMSVILQLIGALVLAVLLSTFAGTLLARRIARPLEGLAGAAAAIAKGNLKQRVELEGKISELHSLGSAFNDMAENLRQSDEAKKAFIADVTHELRTPLTVIKGTIETLEDGALDDAEGRGPLLSSMGRETDRLIRLVNELLVLTRADAGSLQLKLQAIDLAELARSRCEVFAGLAARKGINFGVRDLAPVYPAGKLLDSKAYVLADPDRVSQVIDNLLDNAIRHSPENSTITIGLRPVNGGVECSLADQGTGIPARHLPFIFERFYRVDAARDRKDGGTGLGLAIARALVHAQGGQIRAESVEGRGTTITFWLPIPPSP